jgi:hypothetical protein
MSFIGVGLGLSTMIATSTVSTVATVLYPEIFKSVISLTSKITSGIYHLISISNDAELQNIILNSDIVQDINIIKSFIEDKHKNKTDNLTLISCIDNLNATLIDIEKNIQEITKKTEYNKNLWFTYFRSYDTTKEKENIILLIKQLNHRFELLVKIYSISHNF